MTMAIILVIFSFMADSYQEKILNRRESRISIKYVNEPPGIEVFRKLLAPNLGDKDKIDSTKTASSQELFVLPPEDKNTPQYHDFHLMGTDQNGNDILVNIMKGARTAIWGSLLAILISLVIGLPAGIISGYYGGLWKRMVEYMMSIISTFPKLITLIIIIATIGFDYIVIMVTIGVLGSTKIKDIVQTKIQQFKENQFIEAAKELGLPDYIIIFKHILWCNCKRIIFVQLSYQVAEVILLEASLSYIGWGTQDQISWGYMLTKGMIYIQYQQYWMFFFPAVFIIISILSFLIIGKGFNQWFNIKLPH
jgi:ABC-type dipeptide/oligopeptide/nickel transport system permease subunit